MSLSLKITLLVLAWFALLGLFILLWHKAGYWREREFKDEQAPREAAPEDPYSPTDSDDTPQKGRQ